MSKWISRHRGMLVSPPLVVALVTFADEIEVDRLVWPLGSAISLGGVALRLWAQQHLHYRLKIAKHLTTTGPYAFVCNPIYIGNTLICLGVTVVSELIWLVPLTLIWCLGVYSWVIRHEEGYLLNRYGQGYRRFLPYNTAGANLWSVGFVLLGYSLRESWRLVEHWMGTASAILGGVVVLIIGLVWLGRWLVRQEAELRRWWAGVLAHPRLVTLRRRLAPQLAFAQARLTPGGYLGLHLTVGALIIVAVLWLFGAIAEDVLTGDPLIIIDQRLAVWLHAHATPPLTAAMLGISALASLPVVSAVTVLTALVLAVKCRWYWLLDLLLVVPGGTLLNLLVKDVFNRGRPIFEDALVRLATYSFPSGHTAAATLLYGMLTVFALHVAQSWRGRVAMVLAIVLLVVLVGFSSLYLWVHYLSDVLAAVAEGVAWLALCYTAVETLRRGRERLAG